MSDRGRPAAKASASPPIRVGLLPYIVAATFFMEYLDTTVIATALPQMARSFSVGPNEVSLGMTAYMLTLAVFIPISGWIADRFGSRTVFGGALVLFTLASVLCGFSTGLASFTAARVLQGIGGAMMVPVGRMIVVRNTEKAQMMRAISAITWPAITAPVLGPAVGGFITTYASWNWVFFLNVPFALGALVAVVLYIPNQHDDTRRRLDGAGFVLSGLALICLLYGTELASHEGASVAEAAGFILVGFAVGAVAVRHLRRAPAPLLDLAVMRVPTYSATVLWGSFMRSGIEAVPYLAPLLFQLGFGLSPFQSGLLLLAAGLGNIMMKFCTTAIFQRLGFWWVMVANAVVVSVLIFTCGHLVPTLPLALMIAVLFAYGLSRSLQFQALGTLAYADVSEAQKGPASTLLSVAQQMTIGMGIAFGALCLRAFAWVHRSDAGYTLADFQWAFTAVAVLTLLPVVALYRLPRDAGAKLGAGSRRRGARAG